MEITSTQKYWPSGVIMLGEQIKVNVEEKSPEWVNAIKYSGNALKLLLQHTYNHGLKEPDKSTQEKVFESIVKDYKNKVKKNMSVCAYAASCMFLYLLWLEEQKLKASLQNVGV